MQKAGHKNAHSPGGLQASDDRVVSSKEAEKQEAEKQEAEKQEAEKQEAETMGCCSWAAG